MKKCKYGEYDERSQESIYKYALLLKNKSLDDLYKDEISHLDSKYISKEGKGKIGTLVEKLHFNYEPNSRSEPDFSLANLELKTSPLKEVRGKYVSKERLVLGMIEYFHIDKETFEKSEFLRKNASLLILFYLYEKGKLTEQVFKNIKLWDIPQKDYPIIKQDWEKILQKVRDGKAEEISGGDTFYLEAARKGAGKGKDLTGQPHSDIKANRRAFAFKSKYVNLIINGEEKDLEKVVGKDFEKSNLTLEQYIENKFFPYIGKSISEIAQDFNISYSEQKKDKAAMVAKAILGVKQQNQIEEFEKADIHMKTITLETNGTLKESMSFHQIDYDKLVMETWLNSYFYTNIVNRKFFFVIFRKDKVGQKRLERVMFWNMSFEMQKRAKEFWKDIKAKVEAKDMTHFWRSAEDKDFHVRTKARRAKDEKMLKDGRSVKKLAYWINRATIKRIIQS